MANPERDITATPNKKCMLIKIFRFFEKKRICHKNQLTKRVKHYTPLRWETLMQCGGPWPDSLPTGRSEWDSPDMKWSFGHGKWWFNMGKW
jgi:hypothetical protein